jgi:hypothetical protein
LNYRFQGKRNTLALGVYPAISLATARVRRADTKALLADGIDPGEVKRKKKVGEEANLNETFEAIARSWLAKTKAARAPSSRKKSTARPPLGAQCSVNPTTFRGFSAAGFHHVCC